MKSRHQRKTAKSQRRKQRLQRQLQVERRASFEPLEDRMLLAAGVPARCRQVMGTAHASDTMVILCPDICRDTARSIADFARED